MLMSLFSLEVYYIPLYCRTLYENSKLYHLYPSILYNFKILSLISSPKFDSHFVLT